MRTFNLTTDSNKNFSRAGLYLEWFENKPKMTELIKTLFVEGWEGNKPIDVVPIVDYDQTAELDLRLDIYSEMDSVEATFTKNEIGIEWTEDETLKFETKGIEPRAKVVVSGEEIAKAYKAMVGKSPKWEIINGYRRTFVLPIVNAMLVQLERAPIEDIPVVQHETLTIEQRTIICNKENTLKNKGVQALTDRDLLEMCYHIIYNCHSIKGKSFENKLTNGGVGRGQAQKFGAIFDLNVKTGGKVLEVLRSNTELIKKQDKEALRRLYKEPKDAKDWEESTSDEIMAYVKVPTRVPREKAANASEMKALASQMPVGIVQDILTQAADHSLHNCNKYVEFAVQINAAIAAITGGDDEHPINIAISGEIVRLAEVD